MIVVDTNVISYLYISGIYSELAERLLKKYPIWNVPVLWRSEFCNVLALYLRKNIISYENAVAIIDQAENLLIKNEHIVSSRAILALAKESSCTAYDCEFIQLAVHLDMPLITMDKAILAAFPKFCFSISDYLKLE